MQLRKQHLNNPAIRRLLEGFISAFRENEKIMRRIFLIMAVFASVCITTMAVAKTAEENRLEKVAALLNHSVRQSQGEHAIVQLLKKEFNVDQTMINYLQMKKMGYGEIAVILSLAQQMPDRIAEITVDRILSMRQGPPTAGWGTISDRLGLKLGVIVSQIAGIQREVSEDIKKAQYKEYETGREGTDERYTGGWARKDF